MCCSRAWMVSVGYVHQCQLDLYTCTNERWADRFICGSDLNYSDNTEYDIYEMICSKTRCM